MTATADPYVHDRPVRGRLNAGFFLALDRYLDRLLGDRKRRVLDGIGDTVLEIGPGVGANLPYYPPGTELVAVEPNRRMHPHLRRRARKAGVELALLETGGEAIDLPDDSVQDVVSTLVLCTVEDPRRTLEEIARVLRPGGRFRFVEHVAAPPDTATRRIQRAVKRPWRWAFEGCHVTRSTGRLVADGPFRDVDLERFRMRSPFVLANPAVAGVAIA